jgi:hypothetical protein
MRAWAMDFATELEVLTVVELASRLPDGTIFNTLNPTTAPVFDRPPWIQSEVLPGASVEELLAVHRARIAGLGVHPAEPWDDDPLDTAQREHEAILAYQAERGLMSANAGGYGWTGRGAVRSVHRVAKAMWGKAPADEAPDYPRQ